MVFTHKGWTLHTRDVVLRSGKKFPIYFFAKGKPKSGTPCDIPDGWTVKDTTRGSGMPYLKKK